MFTGCVDRKANLENGVSPPDAEATIAKEDDSIRAIGMNSDGRLLVKPANKARVTPLGAPSCYGVETDLRWSGDYEVVWESKSEGNTTPISTFPIDFKIVQQNNSPVIMQTFTQEDTDIFAYVPRYTDCHGLETYLFGVSNGKAFPISLEIKPGVNWASISQLPHHPFKIINGEFIVIGGYGAGQDFINVYHFKYDPKKKAMILNSTNQVKPNDI